MTAEVKIKIIVAIMELVSQWTMKIYIIESMNLSKESLEEINNNSMNLKVYHK